MRDKKSDQTSVMHWYCFELLIRQIDPLLNEGWAILMTKLLNKFKSVVSDKDELFD